MTNINLWKYNRRLLFLVVVDIFSIIVANLFAVTLQYGFVLRNIPQATISGMSIYVPINALCSIFVYYQMRLYHSVWRYASVIEAFRVLGAYLIIAFFYLIIYLTLDMPALTLLMAYILSLGMCILTRFGIRFFRYQLLLWHSRPEKYQNILLIGGGQTAREIIKDIQLGDHGEYVIRAIIDDNPAKWGRDLEGFTCVGGREKIPEAVKAFDIDTIIFAISNISPANRAEILNLCKEQECELKTVPGLFELYSGQLSVTRLRNVEIEDLLGRDSIKVDNREIFASLKGKTVMVTGGGGSIGSELCRQIANAGVRKLVIFDVYENTTYDIQLELKHRHPELELLALIGDVTDKARVNDVLEKHHPDIIFHAAAHKHVPLMEDSPCEAIKNNVGGTYTIAQAAASHNVQRFLLISTDKAVNPTNIMGASKRLCEMIIQMCQRKYPQTTYMAVRFGNVLGSNGSVIPLFKKQIREGGPVTVTDPNIIRYFMTIPEAVSLVLQASYYAMGGEIFVLDMGKPVKIDDLARNLIKLSGYRPDVDIKIIYTGLRSGEKMYEELLMNEEGLQKTRNSMIFIGKPIEMDDEKFEKDLLALIEASHTETGQMEQLVAEVVPTYHPAQTEEKKAA